MAISALLKNSLKPFEKYFKIKGAKEISINKPGEVWIETYDGWTVKKEPEFTLEFLQRFAKHLATEVGKTYNLENPIISTSIPPYGYRIMIIGFDNCISQFGCSIRIGKAERYPIKSYFGGDKKKADKFIEHLAGNTSMLISGGTGSGKTTFMNSLLVHIPHDQRVITIEDSAELIVDQPNCLGLLKHKFGTNISYSMILDCVRRLRPDKILLGEMDSDNAFSFLDAANSGHGGSLTTIHASSPVLAAHALASKVSESKDGLDEKGALKKVVQTIDVIAQIYNDRKKNTYSIEYEFVNEMGL